VLATQCSHHMPPICPAAARAAPVLQNMANPCAYAEGRGEDNNGRVHGV
jgi:hypothetical protein